MIKANELRCGNMVLYKPYGNRDGERVTIAGILGMKAYFNKYTNESGMLHALMPIPLTEEWLAKFGFKRHDEEDCNGYLAYRPSTAHFSVRLFINYTGHVCAHYSGTAISTNHPQYVHQLQNLYFALTGEELTIKEPA